MLLKLREKRIDEGINKKDECTEQRTQKHTDLFTCRTVIALILQIPESHSKISRNCLRSLCSCNQQPEALRQNLLERRFYLFRCITKPRNNTQVLLSMNADVLEAICLIRVLFTVAINLGEEDGVIYQHPINSRKTSRRCLHGNSNQYELPQTIAALEG